MLNNSDLISLLIICTVVVFIALFFRKVETYDDPLIDRIKRDLIKVDERASKLNIRAADKSYTENKKDMYLCLKDKNGNYYPYNMLTYVGLHELAHAISHKVDESHTSNEFHENFTFLLKKAEELGIYNPNEELIDNYCGVSKNDK